jgi:hypothetical protein
MKNRAIPPTNNGCDPEKTRLRISKKMGDLGAREGLSNYIFFACDPEKTRLRISKKMGDLGSGEDGISPIPCGSGHERNAAGRICWPRILRCELRMQRQDQRVFPSTAGKKFSADAAALLGEGFLAVGQHLDERAFARLGLNRVRRSAQTCAPLRSICASPMRSRSNGLFGCSPICSGSKSASDYILLHFVHGNGRHARVLVASPEAGGSWKGDPVGRWLLRRYIGNGKYRVQTLGRADDAIPANGVEGQADGLESPDRPPASRRCGPNGQLSAPLTIFSSLSSGGVCLQRPCGFEG